MFKKILLMLSLPLMCFAGQITTQKVPSLCVDVRAASSADGTVVQTYQCNGTVAQNWSLPIAGTGSVVALGKCLSNSGNVVVNGNKINLWNCHNGPDQNWSLVGNTLQLVGTTKCLDITNGNFVNSNQLQIWDCQAGNPNQAFSFPIPTPTPPVTPYPGMKLVWQEDFTGTVLNAANWNVEINGNGGGNNELEYYTALPQNLSVSNSNVLLTAVQGSYMGKPYTSARINTQNKFSFTYGRIDVMALLPTGQGMWPAIWLLPNDNFYGGWPLSGEIDIMEMKGSAPNTVYGSLNYGDAWPGNKSVTQTYTLPTGTFNGGYHMFSVSWQPNLIQWYVDNKLYSTKVPADLGQCAAGPCPWRFDKAFYIILNNAVGGNFGGNPNASTTFPQTMRVDWIRVYQ